MWRNIVWIHGSLGWMGGVVVGRRWESGYAVRYGVEIRNEQWVTADTQPCTIKGMMELGGWNHCPVEAGKRIMAVLTGHIVTVHGVREGSPSAPSIKVRRSFKSEIESLDLICRQ